MTNEQIKYKLNEVRMMINDGEHIEEQGIIVECIKSLEQQPSEDCVSRKAVLDILSHYAHNFGADTEIKALSPVTPTRKQGKWVKKSQYGNDYCSECDYEHCGYGYPNYCPNCGAEMRGAENE